MSKLTVIQLLNKIAKGEKVPKEIEYQGTRYIFDENDYKLYKGANLLTENCLTSYINAVMLNDEVEEVIILEDIFKEQYQKLPVKKIIVSTDNNRKRFIEYEDKTGYHTYTIRTVDEFIVNKINELGDKVNYLLQKEGDK